MVLVCNGFKCRGCGGVVDTHVRECQLVSMAQIVIPCDTRVVTATVLIWGRTVRCQLTSNVQRALGVWMSIDSQTLGGVEVLDGSWHHRRVEGRWMSVGSQNLVGVEVLSAN